MTALIRAARHKTADEIRRLLADREPKPDALASMRRIPEPRASVPAPAAECAAKADPSGSRAASTAQNQSHRRACESVNTGALPRPAASQASWGERSRFEPLGGERYGVRFTADAVLHAQLLELQALMRHPIPDGDLGKILARAVPLLLEQVRKRKFGEFAAPKSKKPVSESASRSIPAATRRAVSRRDGEGCSYVSPDGRRCGSREFLEFHHRDPWAHTKAHPPGGITLFCQAHNQHQARRDFVRAAHGPVSEAGGCSGFQGIGGGAEHWDRRLPATGFKSSSHLSIHAPISIRAGDRPDYPHESLKRRQGKEASEGHGRACPSVGARSERDRGAVRAGLGRHVGLVAVGMTPFGDL